MDWNRVFDSAAPILAISVAVVVIYEVTRGCSAPNRDEQDTSQARRKALVAFLGGVVGCAVLGLAGSRESFAIWFGHFLGLLPAAIYGAIHGYHGKSFSPTIRQPEDSVAVPPPPEKPAGVTTQTTRFRR